MLSLPISEVIAQAMVWYHRERERGRSLAASELPSLTLDRLKTLFNLLYLCLPFYKTSQDFLTASKPQNLPKKFNKTRRRTFSTTSFLVVL